MLRKTIIYNYLGRGWTAIISFALIPFYVNYIGIEAYALIGLFGMLQAWLGILDLGMTPTLSREMARFAGGGRSIESVHDLLFSITIIITSISIIIAITIILLSDWMSISWLKSKELPPGLVAEAFMIMGVVSSLRFVEGAYSSAIIGMQQQIWLNIFSSAMATIRGFGAILVLEFVAPTSSTFFLWQGVISIVSLILLRHKTYKIIPPINRAAKFSKAEMIKIWKFSSGVLGITFLSILLTQMDKIILSTLIPLSEFGYYSIATTLAGGIYLTIGPIATALYPKFCELHSKKDYDGLARIYHLGAQLTSVIAGGIAIILIMNSELLINIWTGDAKLANRFSYVLSLLALGNLFNALMWIPHELQLAYGWTSLGIYENIVAVIFIVPSLLYFVPIYGIESAAYAWVILNASYVLISIQVMHTKILPKEKSAWYVKDVISPLFSAIITIIILKNLCPTPETKTEQIVMLIFMSVLTLLAGCFGSPDFQKNLIQYWRKKVSKLI